MKYSLDLSSKKYICPNCGKKTFVIYIGIDPDANGNFVYGRCDREDKCGYFKKPFGQDSSTSDYLENKEKKNLSKYSFTAKEVNSFIGNYDSNNLFNFICTKADREKVKRIFEIYRVGVFTGLSNFDWTLFWQIDGNAWVRTAKMIKYGKDGRRDKSQPPLWYHSLENNKKDDHEPKQCLFGYHLKGLGNPIAVVESEKTAIICSLFIPSYTWMATGGKSNFRLLGDLKGRDVTLFPDLGAFDLWKEKGEQYGCSVSGYLEDIATEEDRNEGLDLADFLMR